MIILTETAKTKVLELLDQENSNLRIFVQGGGCSGLQYGFTFDGEKSDDDFEILVGARSVLIDSLSSEYLRDAVVDYTDGLEGARFVISNPNADTTCGCGSSFSI